MKSIVHNGNGNGKWNASDEMNQLKTNNSDNLLTEEGVVKICSGFFVVLPGNIFEIVPRGQKHVAESELRRGALKLPRGRGRVRGIREMALRGGLD